MLAAVGALSVWGALTCTVLLNINVQKAALPGKLAYAALVAIGNWSYSLYLVHYLLMRPSEEAVDKFQLGVVAPWAAEPVRWITILSCIAASGVAYRYLEAPLISWTHRRVREPASISR